MSALATTLLETADQLIADNGIGPVADAALSVAVTLLAGELGSLRTAELLRTVATDLEHRPNFYTREYFRQ